MDDVSVQDASLSAIEVFLRIKPSNQETNCLKRDDIDESAIFIDVPKHTDEVGTVDNSRTNYAFKFNGILDESCKQDEVFRQIGLPAVKNVMEGLNSTVFAYGQSKFFLVDISFQSFVIADRLFSRRI